MGVDLIRYNFISSHPLLLKNPGICNISTTKAGEYNLVAHAVTWVQKGNPLLFWEGTQEKFKRSLQESAGKTIKDTLAASGNTLESSPSGALRVPSFSHKWPQQLDSLLKMQEKGTKGDYSPPYSQQGNSVPSEIKMIHTVTC